MICFIERLWLGNTGKVAALPLWGRGTLQKGRGNHVFPGGIQVEKMRAPASGVHRATDVDRFKGERSRHTVRPPKGWKDRIPAKRLSVLCCWLERHLFNILSTNPGGRICPEKTIQTEKICPWWWGFFLSPSSDFLCFRKLHGLLLSNPWVLKPLQCFDVHTVKEEFRETQFEELSQNHSLKYNKC